MSGPVVSFFHWQDSIQPRLRDWTAQELAEFYRVEAALVTSGMRVESERGLSDEGDPWFIFCRSEDKEVIAHFARIPLCRRQPGLRQCRVRPRFPQPCGCRPRPPTDCVTAPSHVVEHLLASHGALDRFRGDRLFQKFRGLRKQQG